MHGNTNIKHPVETSLRVKYDSSTGKKRKTNKHGQRTKPCASSTHVQTSQQTQFSVLQVAPFQTVFLTKIKAAFPVEPTRHHNTAPQSDHPSTTTESITHFAINRRIAKHFNSPCVAAHLGPSNVLSNNAKHINLRSSFKVQ